MVDPVHKVVTLDPALINVAAGTQSRVSMNAEAVSDYKDAILAGDRLPPMVVFTDGASFWMADGFHRYEAYIQLGAKEVQCEAHEGTLTDAVAYSAGANRKHGLRRTAEDKRHAVEMVLANPELSKLSNRDIARLVGVSHPFVESIRNPLTTEQREAKKEMERAIEAQRLGDVEQEVARARENPPPLPAAAALASDAPVDEGPEDEELAAQLLADEKSKAVIAELMDADDKLGTAVKEVRRLNLVTAQMQQRIDALLVEKQEALRLLKIERARTARLVKSLDRLLPRPNSPEAKAILQEAREKGQLPPMPDMSAGAITPAS